MNTISPLVKTGATLAPRKPTPQATPAAPPAASGPDPIEQYRLAEGARIQAAYNAAQQPATPAPAAPTAAPAAAAPKPPAPTPEQQVAADTAAGKAAADASGIGKEGSMGRLSDAHAGEANDLLAMQKARLGGMTPEEMQAAREQGTSTINRQLATNLQQLGDIAAGNGIRGGSAAGLQMQALSGAQDASGQLARQMILDNVAQKNIAMDRYGNTLQQQQGVGLGIQGANNDSANAETLARQLYGDNYASRIDAARSGIKANDYTQQGIDLTKAQIDSLNKQAGENKKTSETAGKVGPGVGKPLPSQQVINAAPAMWDYQGKHYVRADTLASGNSANFTDTYTDGNGVVYVDPETSTGIQAAQGAAETARKPPGSTVVCTESYRQGLISGSEYRVTQVYGAVYLTPETHAAYLVWGMPVAEKMRHNARFARCIAWLVRYEIKAMRAQINGKSAPLIGKAVLAAFHGLNFLFGLRKRTAIAA